MAQRTWTAPLNAQVVSGAGGPLEHSEAGGIPLDEDPPASLVLPQYLKTGRRQSFGHEDSSLVKIPNVNVTSCGHRLEGLCEPQRRHLVA